MRAALLVGVSSYPSPEDDLGGGPHNDVMLMAQVLIDRMGFDSSEVFLLLDEEATPANIVASFQRQLAQVPSEGMVLFFFSGHGAQLKDSDGDEEDGLDEVLIMHGSKPGSYGVLRDEHLGQLAGLVQAKNVLFVLDNCYSGTGTRGLARPQALGDVFGAPASGLDWVADTIHGPRAVLPKRLSASEAAGRPYEADDVFAIASPPAPSDHLLLAASAESELAVNVPLRGVDGKTVRVGLLTAALYQTLTPQQIRDWTFATLETALRREATKVTAAMRLSPQTPQVEGTRRLSRIGTYFNLK